MRPVDARGVAAPSLPVAVRGADGSAVVVARRPGRFLIRWQVATGRILARFDADDADQAIRLEGHFCFSHDGRQLYATESESIDGRGQVGVYDALTLQRLGGWSSGGIGPHSIRLLADGQLAVANGGILTLPETGRLKRNRERMDPSLATLDVGTGQLLAQLRLPDPWMSVRHIAQGRSGQVAVALQNEGGPPRPLLALADAGALRYAEASAPVMEACGGYAGDVLALPQGLAVSCTTAGRTALWDWEGRFQGSHATPRVCALARAGTSWIATGDEGDVWRSRSAGPREVPTHWREGVALDNHAVPA